MRKNRREIDFLSRNFFLGFSLLLNLGHNLLDTVHYDGNVFWSILHEFGVFKLTDGVELMVGNPLIPWIAVMSLSYYFGAFYDTSFDSIRRKKLFTVIGISTIVTFFILRFTNLYGDPAHYKD